MKKFSLIICLLYLFIFPVSVFAAGGFSVSTGGVTLHPGESTTITISSDNAVGRLDISSSNGGVASTSTGSVFIQTPGSGQSFTITANSVGSATISVVASEHFATYDTEEKLTGQTRTINVTVVENAPPATPDNSGGGNNNNNHNNNNSNHNNNNNNSNAKNDTKSKNNNLKKISIDGFKIEKVDDHNYKLSVGNTVDEINVIAEAEDAKAKVEGAGKHKLNVGNNTIAITITSESGEQNKITITVNRNQAISLDDLEEIIKTDSNSTISMDIDGTEEISSNILSQLKESGKTLQLNHQDKEHPYSLIIDGKKLKDFDKIQTGVYYDSKNKKAISKLSNYADGVYVSFDQTGAFPDGVELKLYFGDKYSNSDELNIYYYDQNTHKLVLYKQNVLVKDGYLTIPLEQNHDYFFTMSHINSSGGNTIIIILVILLSLCIIVGSFLLYNKKRKKPVVEPVLEPAPEPVIETII